MKARFTMDLAGEKFDEILIGRDASDILGKAKDRAAKELGWKGLFIKAMSPISFAQEGVRRYNAAFKTNHPIPQSAEDFLALGQELGYITILPD